MKAPFSTAVAIAIGLLVLLGYFLPITALSGIRTTLIGWAMILAAFATIIGVINLLTIHFQKISKQEPGNGYSILLIGAFILTLLFGIWEVIFRPDIPISQMLVSTIQVPVETSLMAVLAASLAYASIHLLQRKRNLFSILFFASVLVFLLLGSGLMSMVNFSGLAVVQSLLDRLPVAGGRGLILGVGLGSLLTGIRILVGVDRPYRG